MSPVKRSYRSNRLLGMRNRDKNLATLVLMTKVVPPECSSSFPRLDRRLSMLTVLLRSVMAVALSPPIEFGVLNISLVTLLLS